MAEYIDIDTPIDVAVYQRNRRIQVTLRQILESNDAKYQAADVRPVAHGHNTGKARIFECSECGYGFSDIFLTNERDYQIDPNFCPNCGAWMEES